MTTSTTGASFTNKCAGTLTFLRKQFPDAASIHGLEWRPGRRMGKETRLAVSRFLVGAGLATERAGPHRLRATPPPAGTPRGEWIAQSWRDVRREYR